MLIEEASYRRYASQNLDRYLTRILEVAKAKPTKDKLHLYARRSRLIKI
ncbi:MAG: hypothetical protein RMJ00_00590 [Nitrososphaerota archaeon]|nr:hypothetical protein [Candidatus Bathyarchaeota archaeon]MCX8162423.1 hypothetical protein [Candidatus Bathyarchaeota archaeon]MDW8061187.1 hypothetical protein [Nitrososphaerota archaeon]